MTAIIHVSMKNISNRRTKEFYSSYTTEMSLIKKSDVLLFYPLLVTAVTVETVMRNIRPCSFTYSDSESELMLK